MRVAIRDLGVIDLALVSRKKAGDMKNVATETMQWKSDTGSGVYL